jgi:Bacterial regulatory protein, Fis family
MGQFPQLPFFEPPASQPPISSASRRRLARHLVGLPLKDIERDLVLETLASTDGNRATTARLLGLSVRTLQKRITEYSADGLAVTPRRGGPSLSGKQDEGARQHLAGTPRNFLQQDAIVDDARLEQATRQALRVRLHPVASGDHAVSSDLAETSEESIDVGRHGSLARRLRAALAAVFGKLIPSAR